MAGTQAPGRGGVQIQGLQITDSDGAVQSADGGGGVHAGGVTGSARRACRQGSVPSDSDSHARTQTARIRALGVPGAPADISQAPGFGAYAEIAGASHGRMAAAQQQAVAAGDGPPAPVPAQAKMLSLAREIGSAMLCLCGVSVSLFCFALLREMALPGRGCAVRRCCACVASLSLLRARLRARGCRASVVTHRVCTHQATRLAGGPQRHPTSTAAMAATTATTPMPPPQRHQPPQPPDPGQDTRPPPTASRARKRALTTMTSLPSSRGGGAGRGCR